MTDTTDIVSDWNSVAASWADAVDYIDSHSMAATKIFVDRLAVRPGDRILELAAGPGSLGQTWSNLAGGDGHVVLSDIAPEMVEAARRRNADLANVDAAVVDASSIEFPDGSFDVAACRMGLMFTPDPAIAFGEIHRVLRPNGRVGALTWGAIEHNPWMTCVGMAAMMNGVVSNGPPVGPGGIFSLSDPAALEAYAVGAGFADVAVEEIATTFHADSIETHVDRVSSLAGSLATAFAAASAEQLDAVRRSAAQLAADYTTADGVTLPGRVVLVTGRKPVA